MADNSQRPDNFLEVLDFLIFVSKEILMAQRSILTSINYFFHGEVHDFVHADADAAEENVIDARFVGVGGGLSAVGDIQLFGVPFAESTDALVAFNLLSNDGSLTARSVLEGNTVGTDLVEITTFHFNTISARV